MRTFNRLLLVLIVIGGIGGVLDIMNFWSRGHHLWESAPVPKTPEQKDTEERIKCRAYTMAADFVGTKKRLEADKIRLLCTVLNIEKTGIDACDVFRFQSELVVPGWGRRKTDSYNYFLGRYTYVPQRYALYIETIDPDISERDRSTALALAERVKKDKLCPPDWKAVVIIRPERPHTVGNQRADELAAIKDTEKMVRQIVTGESEYEFYYPKK